MKEILSRIKNWTRDEGGQAAIIGFALLAISFMYLWGRWELHYGLAYAFSWLIFAFTYQDEKTTSILAPISALIAVLMSVGYLDAGIGLAINAVLFALTVACNMNYLQGGIIEQTAPAILFWLLWLLWSASYFYIRITNNWPLIPETILYHGGILLYTITKVIEPMLGEDTAKMFTVISLIIAIIGAWLLTATEGWGLLLF